MMISRLARFGLLALLVSSPTWQACARAPATRELTHAEVASFNQNGYVVIRGMFSRKEAAILAAAGKKDPILARQAFHQKDQNGSASKLLVWNQPVPESNVFNAVARSRRLVNAAEKLLGGECYHWHSKLMLKEPEVGGAWEWHQDYGYWYNQGLLYPDLVSAMVALEPATRANGCLQLLAGTHRMGRIEHRLLGQQQGAAEDRVAAAKERHELVHVEMDPGDVAFFHALTLHASAPNPSNMSRWALTSCYNLGANDPIKKSFHPNYSPLVDVDDGHVTKLGAITEWTAESDLLDAEVNEKQAAWSSEEL